MNTRSTPSSWTLTAFSSYGALMQSTTPNQIIGVLAHETGHIVGGHLSKMRQELARAQTLTIIAMLLGAGAMVAGAQSPATWTRAMPARRR